MAAWDETCRIEAEIRAASESLTAAEASGDATAIAAALAALVAAKEQQAAHQRQLNEEPERNMYSFTRGSDY